MKLSCTQENLNRSLAIVSHIASRNANLPILNNVLLKIKDKMIKLVTTNLEIGISCGVRGKIEEEGAATLEAKLLTDYISLLPNERVDIKLRDQNVEIKCKNFETKMRATSAEEFPLLPQIEKASPYICKISDLREALSQVIFAVSPNETRPEINGVLFNFVVEGGENKLILAATDSYRLAEKKLVTIETVPKPHSVIVPAKTLGELLRILSILKDADEDISDTLSIYISENQILFSCGDVEIISRIIEGQYPDYRQIIPETSRTLVTVTKSDFIKAVKAASLFAKSGINGVNLILNPKKENFGEIIISASSSQAGENTSKIEAKIEGEKNSIILNYRYLLDGLQNIDSEEIILGVNDSNSPCFLRPTKKTDYLYLIMPIKQ